MRILLSLAAMLLGANAFAVDGPKPNIIFILADDLGFADVGFNGGKEIRTPNIDALAATGAVLKQHYVQPVCSPTRAALMTGRYPMRHGLQVGVVRPWAQYGLPLEETTLPQMLKTAGYQTAISGKWHLGHFKTDYLPTHRGFDSQYGHYNGAIDYNTHLRDGGFDWHRNDQECRDEGYSTFLLAKEAARVIKERDPKKPLFLYVPFNAVHAPHQTPAKYKQPYTHLKEPRQTYAGMLAAMDEAIGDILKAVDEAGIRNDTLIVFSSDNGGPQPGKVTDNGPYRAGKATLYEGGVRVAACVSYPGKIAAKSTIDQPMHMADWYPTFANLAGVKEQRSLPLDGMDVWPMLAEGKPSPRKEILHNTTPQSGAIRMGDWKLILNGSAGEGEDDDLPAPKKKNAAKKTELFNIATDPYEKTNQAEKEPGKVTELKTRYDELAKQAAAPKNAPKSKDFVTPRVWGEPN